MIVSNAQEIGVTDKGCLVQHFDSKRGEHAHLWVELISKYVAPSFPKFLFRSVMRFLINSISNTLGRHLKWLVRQRADNWTDATVGQKPDPKRFVESIRFRYITVRTPHTSQWNSCLEKYMNTK